LTLSHFSPKRGSQSANWLTWNIFRIEPGAWSAAGTNRQVQSQWPQSQVWVVMTDPSVEAFFPTMMTVHPSRTGTRGAKAASPSAARFQEKAPAMASAARRQNPIVKLLVIIFIMSPPASFVLGLETGGRASVPGRSGRRFLGSHDRAPGVTAQR